LGAGSRKVRSEKEIGGKRETDEEVSEETAGTGPSQGIAGGLQKTKKARKWRHLEF
jgi:hypothetical protein